MDKPSDFDLLARKILDSLNSKYFIGKIRKGEGDGKDTNPHCCKWWSVVA